MKKFLFSLLTISVFSTAVFSQKSDPIKAGFLNPPKTAKPRVWWHWMNGNITKDGIKKDLLWMQKSGIGGFQNFDAAMMTPQIVKQRLVYMTPAWKDAFKYTTKLADSLKLEMAIAGSPGWSETGGPWVKPADGMKKPVWTELRVRGGQENIVIAKPNDITGPFQSIPKQADFGAEVNPTDLPHFYKDITVLAFKLPAADKSLAELGATISASGGNFTLAALTDGDLSKGILLPRDDVKGFAWIQFEFPQPTTIKAITMVGGGNPGVFGQGADPADARALEISDDGINYKFITTIFIGSTLQNTLSIPATTAKYFRIKIKNPPPSTGGLAALLGAPSAPVIPPGVMIQEINLYPADRLHMFEEKAAFTPVMDLEAKRTLIANDVIEAKDIIDLTSKMDANGKLNWKVPAGDWKIMRFGYSLMGIENHPASPEATGLEVDKMNPAAINRYFTNYLNQYKSATGGLMGAKGGLQFMVTDSWEAGAQNWTANLPEEFLKRRGYSLIPWLPALTGHIIKSATATEAFLFDFRKTIGDLTVAYHYDGLTNILARYGMKRYSESHEDERRIIADGMEVKRTAAIPMSAMWTPNPFINGNDQHKYTADIRESASVAHIYGQNIVAAESFTALGLPAAAWSYAPENLKSTADLELANGLNRFVIHCSTHQPLDDKIPGLGLGPFGQWFNRHETWANHADVWINYLARSSYLLQQGKFVADVAVFYGEDNNITSLYRFRSPSIPTGYNYDFVNSDILLHELTYVNGYFTTKTGMKYKVLFLDSNAKQMSIDVLKKIKSFVDAGAIVTGIKPERPTGLKDNNALFYQLVNKIWSPAHQNISTGKKVQEVLTQAGVSSDFSFNDPNAKIMYVHRKLKDKDIYWVNNRKNEAQKLDIVFRVIGKEVELWHPETGKIEKANYAFVGNKTKVTIDFTPNDAVFVVFGKKTTQTTYTKPIELENRLIRLAGGWEVNFQKDRGAPESITMDELKSLTENENTGVKYFSGTATYTQYFDVPQHWLNNYKGFTLDLGIVKEMAEVIINGQSIGVAWKTPYQLEISNALRAGSNKIEIKVTNLWVNRLIGDAQSEEKNKITYTTMPFYQANSTLLPSGLIGPVILNAVKK